MKKCLNIGHQFEIYLDRNDLHAFVSLISTLFFAFSRETDTCQFAVAWAILKVESLQRFPIRICRLSATASSMNIETQSIRWYSDLSWYVNGHLIHFISTSTWPSYYLHIFDYMAEDYISNTSNVFRKTCQSPMQLLPELVNTVRGDLKNI